MAPSYGRRMDRPTGPDALESFLVERYWPGIDLPGLRSVIGRLDSAAEAMTAEGVRVQHLGSILMPVDEVVFSLIAAADESVVRDVNARAGLPVDRITVAVTVRSSNPLPAALPDLQGGLSS
jgi:hypothetical protein